MSEKDYAPLSAACVRALHDKLYEKRKTAALEIEKMVKEFAALNNTSQIRRLLKVLGQDFALSQNPHARKGGLIGLAATAIALGKDTSNYTDELIKPILGCLSDQDLRVRYYACESLYNVVKVSRGAVLPHFSAIFNALSKIATDPDQHVKNASELLDRLLKSLQDIVTESTCFDLEGFMPLLRERIYTKVTFARQFVISWISVLDMVPDIDLLFYLPEILDGLFRILGDTNLEVKKMCETTLSEFLRNIKSDPSKVNFPAMINILISHAQEKNDDLVQFIAITWIKEFVQLSGPAMLPYMSGIFTAVLPCLAYDSDARRMTDIKETATAVNFTLMKLIAVHGEDNQILNRNAGDAIFNVFLLVLKFSIAGDESTNFLDLPSVVDVLTQYIMHNSIQTKVAVLKWIHDLYTKLPDEMVNHIDVLFPALQRTLSDEADQVVQQCLVVIAEVIASPVTKRTSPTNSDGVAIKHLGCNTNPYYNKFLISLLQSFNTEKRLLDERGSFIIRQLCVLLNAEDIYRNLAHILLNEPNLKFARLMVEHLNMILLTSSELFEMRSRLKELNTEVGRCGNLEVTVDFLMEIDKLVQLIESPIFAYLRLELLQVPCDKNLIRALYGLLMLLPQTDAFQTLKVRLSCIPSLHLHCEEKSTVQERPIPACKRNIDFAKLLQHFIEVQEKYKEYKKLTRVKDMTYTEKELSNLEI
ncbi:Vac14 Fig4 bd domain containing protein [Asbolus verrucosus]|uniref:Protein VAC14 homolog n=1 Tax=Asbolus verrucosus TaxID=1661398 RepID=A0A482WA89_ASBVE|nr:Vac14 Fig4 bd domain containing protein [Asbolus verrucosus]